METKTEITQTEIDELINIAKNESVFPGDTLSHASANSLVQKGYAIRNKANDFCITELGKGILKGYWRTMKMLSDLPGKAPVT